MFILVKRKKLNVQNILMCSDGYCALWDVYFLFWKEYIHLYANCAKGMSIRIFDIYEEIWLYHQFFINHLLCLYSNMAPNSEPHLLVWAVWLVGAVWCVRAWILINERYKLVGTLYDDPVTVLTVNFHVPITVWTVIILMWRELVVLWSFSSLSHGSN